MRNRIAHIGSIVVIIIALALVSFDDKETVSTSPRTDEDKAPREFGLDLFTSSEFVSGEYTATVSYDVPSGGNETMSVIITLEDDVVTAVDYEYQSNHKKTEEVSAKYQERFSGASQSFVVGLEINDIELSRIGGASLTSAAFNEALTDIKRQAS